MFNTKTIAVSAITGLSALSIYLVHKIKCAKKERSEEIMHVFWIAVELGQDNLKLQEEIEELKTKIGA